MTASGQRYRMHLPQRFLQKEVNEHAVCEILSRALGTHTARRGDPQLREPDLFLDGVGVEVTIATEGKHRPTFLGEYCDGLYLREEAQNAMTLPILSALERKSKKEYASRPVAVAVLCMLELFDWSGDIYGRSLDGLPVRERDAFFSILNSLYLERGIFSDIYLLTPTLFRSWAVFDIRDSASYLVPVKESDDLPYFAAED